MSTITYISTYAIPGVKPIMENPERIAKVVAQYFNISLDDIKKKEKNHEYVIPRQVAMYFYRRLTKMSLHQIGAIFKKDHATVIHAQSAVETNMRTNYKGVRTAVIELQLKLK